MRTKLRTGKLMMTQNRNARCDRRGATIVEFALVAPIFLLLIFICFEFCRVNMIRNLVQDAAYFAARHAMVPGATEQEAVDEANRILGLMNTRDAAIVINGGNGLDDDSETVSVSITVPMDKNSLIVPKFTGDMDFSSTATMRTERYDGFYDPFE